MMDSMTQQQELFVTLSDSGTIYDLYNGKTVA